MVVPTYLNAITKIGNGVRLSEKQLSSDTQLCIDQYVIDASNSTLSVLMLPDVLALQHIVLDDLEFRIEEAIDADELAQEIFTATGGSLEEHWVFGESESLYIYYDKQLPGQLGLEAKAGQARAEGQAFVRNIF
jgi:hypothetical protein